MRKNSDLKFFGGSMILTGFRCELGETGESELAMLANGRSGRDLGSDRGASERLRLGCGRAAAAWAPSKTDWRASGEETEGRDASVVAGGERARISMGAAEHRGGTHTLLQWWVWTTV